MPADPILNYADIRFDAQGKPYYTTQSGKRSYLSPIVAMQSQNPQAVEWARSMGVFRSPEGEITNKSAPGANYLQDRGHWDPATGRWKQDTSWENIIASVGAAGPLIGPAIAGAAAPTAAGGIAAPTAAESAAGIASLEGAGMAGGTAGGTAATLGTVMPAVTAGGSYGDILRRQLMSPQGIATAGTIAASLAAGGNGTNDATRASEEQARRMQAITEARMRRVDPLHEAITQLAFGRLPVSSRQGLSLPRVTLPE